MELLLAKVPVAAVEPTKNWAKSAVVALRVRSARTVMSCSRPMLPVAKLASRVPSSARMVVVPDLQVRGSTLQQWRVHEARGREAVDREVRRGIHSGGVLQVRDTLAQGVEVGDQRIPSVRLALSPAVAAELQSAAVAQDGLAGERGLAQQVANDHRSELGLNQVENAAALGARGVWEVTGVQRTQIIRPQEAGSPPRPWTRSRFGCGAWTGCRGWRRPPAGLQEVGSARCGA